MPAYYKTRASYFGMLVRCLDCVNEGEKRVSRVVVYLKKSGEEATRIARRTCISTTSASNTPKVSPRNSM